jgi:hypothetical protein
VRGQLQGAGDGSWSLGDDSLPALAGSGMLSRARRADRTAPATRCCFRRHEPFVQRGRVALTGAR